MKRLALSALLATFAVLTATPTAFAHTELLSSNPVDGATLSQPPTKLTLTFSEPVPAESATITITVPDGSQWPTGEIAATGPTLTAQVTPQTTPPGQYTLSWQVVALDGDYVNGKTTFTLPSSQPTTPSTSAPPSPTSPSTTPSSTTSTSTTGAPTTAAPTSSTEPITEPATAATPQQPESGALIWPWIVGALILVALGVAVALRLKDRKEQQGRDDETPEQPSE
ncbi:copper resistance CopC family protein [Actinosynnema sp. NPDC047251]|uniref:CopC domain-containing protein n=1 Tax=Saccharothrix espanaensis (strain ATCC 51144 / DSM 44229 / JCM 9112 / NBRC 15066 / NRRL 15764) TaxID=1179773 RepID=K0JV14_SACES|nr:copper resistance CopC family protein [Saccharothrix espanaensis]CCH29831.1 hypothetical protein BN6_25170 [Saccharothrix espanaensis DSM 44229]